MWRPTRRRRWSGLPPSPDGYSLIVDGTAAAGSGDGEIVVTPTKAILHRPAVDAEGKRTGSDCAPADADVPLCVRTLALPEQCKCSAPS